MIGSPRMRSVQQVKVPTNEQLFGCCYDQVRLLGGLGYCRRHSPYLTPQNMGWPRFLYHKARLTGKMILVAAWPQIITIAAIVAFASLIYWAAMVGAEKQELVACNAHLRYMSELVDYTISDHERQRCDDLGVIIDPALK